MFLFQIDYENKLGINFKSGDIEDLTNKLKQMLVSDLSAISIREKEYYMSNYSKESIRQSLLEIYKNETNRTSNLLLPS